MATAELKDFKEINIADIQYDTNNSIGSGGFGDVYKATYTDYGDLTVAIKILRQKDMSQNGIPDKDVKKFRQEAKKMFETKHSHHVVPVYGFVVSKEKRTYGLVMEYMENGSYCDFMEKGLNIPWGLRIDMLFDIACGLEDIHSKGIIHCDIKLDNIMVNKDLKAKISDFGVSQVLKSASSSLSKSTSHGISSKKASGFGGTWDYMSPERLKSIKAKPNVKTDVYSYGITAYLMLTNGTSVFQDDITATSYLKRTNAVGWECPADDEVINKLTCPDYIRDILNFVKDGMLVEKPEKRRPFRDIMGVLNNYITTYVNDTREEDKVDIFRQLSAQKKQDGHRNVQTNPVTQPTDEENTSEDGRTQRNTVQEERTTPTYTPEMLDSIDAGPPPGQDNVIYSRDEASYRLPKSMLTDQSHRTTSSNYRVTDKGYYQARDVAIVEEGISQLGLDQKNPGSQTGINVNINVPQTPPVSEAMPEQPDQVHSQETIPQQSCQASSQSSFQSPVSASITQARRDARKIFKNVTNWKEFIREFIDFSEERAVIANIEENYRSLSDKVDAAYIIYLERKGRDATFNSLANLLSHRDFGLKYYGGQIIKVCEEHNIPTDTTLC